jgi:hypothetical protein
VRFRKQGKSQHRSAKRDTEDSVTFAISQPTVNRQANTYSRAQQRRHTASRHNLKHGYSLAPRRVRRDSGLTTGSHRGLTGGRAAPANLSA